MSFEMSRKQYAEMYGPTTGDAIRLADVALRDGRIFAIGKASCPGM